MLILAAIKELRRDLYQYYFLNFLKEYMWGFLGGTVVKNPSANAGDTGSSPGPGRSHMPRSN